MLGRIRAFLRRPCCGHEEGDHQSAVDRTVILGEDPFIVRDSDDLCLRCLDAYVQAVDRFSAAPWWKRLTGYPKSRYAHRYYGGDS